MGERYYSGTGKRKTAIAQVRLYPGGSSITINGRPFSEVFPWLAWQTVALEPLKVTNTQGQVSVMAKIEGGGISAWAQALRHGITRALIAYDEDLKPQLRRYGLVTRDARIKESKKYGLRRARRAKQYTKR
ncbi:MAG: 30S ribosomal protein S9 [Chloroflexi bacterium]|nr:30S ribosomal protein S9 [Chloroflexota bacterium]